MPLKLIHPDNPQDVAIVEPGSSAEAYHRARGLVDEGKLKEPEPEPEPEPVVAPSPKAKAKR